MPREQQKLIINVHKALDIGITISAFVAAYFIKRLFLTVPLRGLTIESNYYVVLLMIIIIWYVTFVSFSLYASYRRRAFSEIFLNMLNSKFHVRDSTV